MDRWKKKPLIFMVVTVFWLTATVVPAMAQTMALDASAEEMILDFVLIRPLGFAGTVVGISFFVVTLPFTIWSKEQFKKVKQAFIVEPVKFTFARPLGEF